jgi:hypothetical protein
VFAFLSVNNIVIPPANTGNDNTNNTAVIFIAQANNGILSIVIPPALIFIIVVIKFIAPNIDDIPAKCKLNIAISTAPPLCPIVDDNGGYTVHPGPAPPSTIAALNNNTIDGGINQNDKLFNLGNAISGAPIIIGTIQFPNPPTNTGINMKNIIINPCNVIIPLYIS